jgi:hypothetical protein
MLSYRGVVWAAGILLSGGVAATPLSAQDTAARDLLQKVIDALPKESFVAKMRLTTPSGVREFDLSHKIANGVRSSFMQVTGPAELKGIRFLFFEPRDKPPQQYIKVAASRRGVLVTNEARLQPFLGSSFAVADLVEPNVDAFTHRAAGEEEILGRKCTVVESIPKQPATEPYGKTLIALDPADRLALKRRFFDQQGHEVKVWEVLKVEQVDGAWTIMDQQMKDIAGKTASRLEVVTLQRRVELADSIFTPEHLVH